MDEHDFDQILQTDFHPNTAPPPQLTEPTSAQHQQEHDTQTQGLLQNQDVEDSIDPYDAQQQAFLHDSDDRYESQSPQQREREKVPTASLDAVDKKQRQREQNRVAALRSRSKKNGKYGEMEKQVESMSAENEKLRARLKQLQADRPGPSFNSSFQPPSSSSNSAQNSVPQVDEQYFRKVTTNLESAKLSLLYRELELENARDPEGHHQPYDGPAAEYRAKVVQAIGNLAMIQAETKSMESMARNLSLERQNLINEREGITREYEARMAVKSINGLNGLVDQGEDDVEKVLLEVRGWLQEAIDKWDDPEFEVDQAMDDPTLHSFGDIPSQA